MKHILTLILLLSLGFGAKASHLMGGEIVVKHLNGNDYEVRITRYRDTMGINLATIAYLSIDTFDAATNSYINFQGPINVPLDSALSTSLIPNFPYGVEVGVYVDTVSLVSGQFRFRSNTCCRNYAILNMATPGSESFGIYTEFTVPAVDTNSSPDFMLMPVTYFPVNTPITFNPLPYDPDNDSISWQLDTPRSSMVFNQFDTVDGFVPPSADPTGPFTMNPVSGQITWTPDMVGNFVQSFKVDEYRNGSKQGTIIRDYQYVVITAPPTNPSMPVIKPTSNVNYNSAQDYYYIKYSPTYELVFELTGSDIDTGSTLTLQPNSKIFQQSNPATFTTSMDGDDIKGTLKWTPPVDFDEDVILVFRLRDGMWTTDYTLMLTPSPLSIADKPNSISDAKCYPNPTSGGFTLSMKTKTNADCRIEILNALGQRVDVMYEGDLPSGTWSMGYDKPLAGGQYFIHISRDGERGMSLPIRVN